MRNFSEYEKLIIKRIVSECDNVGFSISMDIIIQEMGKDKIVAIEWDKTYTYTKFYGINDSKTIANVYDIIFLLKYLVENRFLYVHSNKEVDYSIFNIEKYKKVDEFYYRIIDENTLGIGEKMYVTIHTNIGEEIQTVSRGILYPSFVLRDLVQNDFKTPEQREFDKQLTEAKKQTGYSRGALYVSLVALILSLISTLFTTCSDTRIDSKQFKQIKQSIEKFSLPKETKTVTINNEFKEK